MIAEQFDSAVNTPWFLTVDLIGTVAFALSGITIARAEGYSIFGAMVLAFLPALGGGLVMDLMAGRQPLAIMAHPAYMQSIIAVVLAARLGLWLIDRVRGRWIPFFDIVQWYLTANRTMQPMTLLILFDAIGMAGFTVTAVFTAVQFHCDPLLLWGPVFAMMNAALGTILRDVVRADADNPILKGSFYAEVAIVWGLLLSWWVETLPEAIPAGIAITLVGVTATRLLLYTRGVRAPMF